MGTKGPDGWITQVITANHNGSNPAQVQAVKDAHPDEPDVMARNRVLGALAVTRGEEISSPNCSVSLTSLSPLMVTPSPRRSPPQTPRVLRRHALPLYHKVPVQQPPSRDCPEPLAHPPLRILRSRRVSHPARIRIYDGVFDLVLGRVDC